MRPLRLLLTTALTGALAVGCVAEEAEPTVDDEVPDTGDGRGDASPLVGTWTLKAPAVSGFQILVVKGSGKYRRDICLNLECNPTRVDEGQYSLTKTTFTGTRYISFDGQDKHEYEVADDGRNASFENDATDRTFELQKLSCETVSQCPEAVPNDCGDNSWSCEAGSCEFACAPR